MFPFEHVSAAQYYPADCGSVISLVLNAVLHLQEVSLHSILIFVVLHVSQNRF